MTLEQRLGALGKLGGHVLLSVTCDGHGITRATIEVGTKGEPQGFYSTSVEAVLDQAEDALLKAGR